MKYLARICHQIGFYNDVRAHSSAETPGQFPFSRHNDLDNNLRGLGHQWDLYRRQQLLSLVYHSPNLLGFLLLVFVRVVFCVSVLGLNLADVNLGTSLPELESDSSCTRCHRELNASPTRETDIGRDDNAMKVALASLRQTRKDDADGRHCCLASGRIQNHVRREIARQLSQVIRLEGATDSYNLRRVEGGCNGYCRGYLKGKVVRDSRKQSGGANKEYLAKDADKIRTHSHKSTERHEHTSSSCAISIAAELRA
jgi:hypothetical protein